MTSITKTMFLVFCIMNAMPIAIMSQQLEQRSSAPAITLGVATSGQAISVEPQSDFDFEQAGYIAGGTLLTGALIPASLIANFFLLGNPYLYPMVAAWLIGAYLAGYCWDKAFFGLDIESFLHNDWSLAIGGILGAPLALAVGGLGLVAICVALSSVISGPIIWLVPAVLVAVGLLGVAYVAAKTTFTAIGKGIKYIFGTHEPKSVNAEKKIKKSKRHKNKEVVIA